jgi:hypothetical protein
MSLLCVQCTPATLTAAAQTRTHIDYRNIAHRRNNRNLKTSPHYGPHLDHRANHTRQRRLQLAAI